MAIIVKNDKLLQKKHELIIALERESSEFARKKFQILLAEVEKKIKDRTKASMPEIKLDAVASAPVKVSKKDDAKTAMRHEYREQCQRYKNLMDEINECRKRKKYLRETLGLVRK